MRAALLVLAVTATPALRGVCRLLRLENGTVRGGEWPIEVRR